MCENDESFRYGAQSFFAVITTWILMNDCLLLHQVGDKDCSCGGEMKRGICVKPKRGDAVLFWSMVGVSLIYFGTIFWLN